MPANNVASVQYYRHLPAPTVHPHPNFNAQDDADALKKAMKGFGCDEKVIMNILCNRSSAQRQQIKEAFKLKYGDDLIKEIKSELKGDLEDLIVALLYTPADYDALELYKAMKGLGTDELTLIEIMTTRTNAEILAIKKAYQQAYGKDLEKALADDTSSHFKNFLVSLCNASRDESPHVDQNLAKIQAQQLHDAGATFSQILATQNFAQLKQLFREYALLAQKDMESAVDKDIGGDIKEALLAVVQIAKGKDNYFVNRINNAMKGMGTDDKTLIRVIASRSERDLLTICQEWERQFANSLENAISAETSGKYKDALLLLIKGGQ
uniref:Annexin n=1 Tax=Romanomermis culicivorax TaxID=13658 RepID=A0A915K404_ROMCU